MISIPLKKQQSRKNFWAISYCIQYFAEYYSLKIREYNGRLWLVTRHKVASYDIAETSVFKSTFSPVSLTQIEHAKKYNLIKCGCVVTDLVC